MQEKWYGGVKFNDWAVNVREGGRTVTQRQTNEVLIPV